MSYIHFNIRSTRLLFFFFISIFILYFSGCSSPPQKREVPEGTPLRDSTMSIYTPKAAGTMVHENDIISMDVSNTSQGYVIVTYSGTNEKVKLQITSPDNNTYTYLITEYSKAIVYPLTEGNGTYTFTLYESVNAPKDLYAIAFTQSTDVVLEDKFFPFLTPNVYVTYDADSSAVLKGVELAQNCYFDLDVIENIYHYVTENITYDEAKAKSVAYGYIPNPDQTLAEGKGICFDFAALMTAMLRSQRIPTKLEVGYAGDVYHAWISCYIEEEGWVDGIIQFDGKKWTLMDPTLAASNDKASVQQYIGDGTKYTVKYIY